MCGVIFLNVKILQIYNTFKKILALGAKFRNMTIRLIIISILVALTQSVTAQEDSQPWQCASLKYKLAGKQTTADPAEENYDVKYVKFNLDVTNLSKVLS